MQIVGYDGSQRFAGFRVGFGVGLGVGRGAGRRVGFGAGRRVAFGRVVGFAFGRVVGFAFGFGVPVASRVAVAAAVPVGPTSPTMSRSAGLGCGRVAATTAGVDPAAPIRWAERSLAASAERRTPPLAMTPTRTTAPPASIPRRKSGFVKAVTASPTPSASMRSQP
jgi:hypothetical protein